MLISSIKKQHWIGWSASKSCLNCTEAIRRIKSKDEDRGRYQDGAITEQLLLGKRLVETMAMAPFSHPCTLSYVQEISLTWGHCEKR